MHPIRLSGLRYVWVPVALLSLLAIIAPSKAEEATAPSLDSTRDALSKWVETQAIISREKKEWQQAREMLLSRIEIVTREHDLLEERLGETGSSMSELRKTEAGLAAQRRSSLDVTERLGGQVVELEGKVRGLYAVLPESLREKLEPLYERIPEDLANTKVTMAERFQNILGILNEMNRINNEITVASEIRPLSNGSPSEVKTIYVGLGQAYFVSAGGEAGVGRPSENGWTWEPANHLAPEINHALEILQNKSSPKFVPLPVSIR